MNSSYLFLWLDDHDSSETASGTLAAALLCDSDGQCPAIQVWPEDGWEMDRNGAYMVDKWCKTWWNIGKHGRTMVEQQKM